MWQKISATAHGLRRRFFGSYQINDPRPVAAEAPYSYYLPPIEKITAIEPGDNVKLVFQSVPQSHDYDAERMWVTVTQVGSGAWHGTLNNIPLDMPQLKLGSQVTFQSFCIIDVDFADETKNQEFESASRSYLERCLVDKCVTSGERPIFFIYREKPDMRQDGDLYDDSGWRIRGDYRDVTDEEFESWEIEYIAVSKVLNKDDTWLNLIDEPVGSAFYKDFETGQFVPKDEFESAQ